MEIDDKLYMKTFEELFDEAYHQYSDKFEERGNEWNMGYFSSDTIIMIMREVLGEFDAVLRNYANKKTTKAEVIARAGKLMNYTIFAIGRDRLE